MKKVSKKDNVKKIILQNQDFYYRIDNKIFKNNIVVMDLENDFFGDFYIYKNQIIVQSFYGDIIYKDKKYDGYYNYLNENEFTYLNSNDDNLYLVDENNIDRKLNIEQNFYQYEKYCIIIDKNQIILKNLENPNPLWQFSLSSLGKFKNLYTNEEETIEVRQFIGVYNNILWLFLNKTGFIGLDITTGNLKHHISKNDVLIGETAVTSYTENENGRMSFFRSQYYLDEQKGKIIGLAVDILFEMDLNRDTPFVTQYGLQKQYQKYGINEQNIANDFVLKDNLLYFYAFNQLKFGILNIKTKEIIYISEPIIPENNKVTQLKDLQVSDNKIYILDSDNTLHIFEEENYF